METILKQYKEKFGVDVDTFELADFVTVNELKEMLQCAIDECRPVSFNCQPEFDP
jgi:hypothetical protein